MDKYKGKKAKSIKNYNVNKNVELKRLEDPCQKVVGNNLRKCRMRPTHESSEKPIKEVWD